MPNLPVVPKPKKSSAGKPRHPKREVIRGLARYLSSPEAQQTRGPAGPNVAGIDKYIKGLSGAEVRRTAAKADVPAYLGEIIANRADQMRAEEAGARGGFDLNPVSAFGWTLKQASRPVQAVESGVAEWSRQGENNPVNIGPISLRFGVKDPSKILDAMGEGLALKRHDSPATIAAQAGRIRARQGENTKSFGLLPGTDIRKAEVLPYLGKVGTVAYDVGGGAGLDPFTYATFGVSALAKLGLNATARVLGAERAAEVAAQGTRILSAEEKLRLGRDTVRRLAGVRGGVAVRVPQPRRALQGEKLLSPPKTIIPGKYLGKGLLEKGIVRAGATKPGALFSDLFIPRARLKQLEREGRVPMGTAARLEGMQSTARGTATAAHQQNVAYLRQVAKETRLSSDDAARVAIALDTGNPEGLEGAARVAFDKVDEYRNRMSGRVREAGLIPEEGKVDAAGNPLGIDDPTHYPHVPRISGESRAAGVAADAPAPGQVKQLGFTTDGRFSAAEGTQDAGFAQKRTGGSLEEELAAGNDLETNPFAAYASRSLEQERALAAKTFTDEALALKDSEGLALLAPADDFAARNGVDVTDLTDDFLRENGVERIQLKGQPDLIVDAAIAPEFRKMVSLGSPDAANVFLRGLDKWMTLWKGYATVPLPFGFGFHMRNATGNVMLNWLADISPADSAYVRSYTIQRRIARGMKEGDPLKYLSGESRYIAQEALRRDIIGGGGFFFEDIPVDQLREFRSWKRKVGEAANPLDQNNILIRSGRAMGKGVEENARLAHFIAKYKLTGNFDDAATSVRRYLFDYADLTKFEQKGMKRIIPFYTFARKNTPLWVGAAFKQPGKYSRLGVWRTAFLDAAGRPLTEVQPQYLEANAAVPLPFPVAGQTAMFSPDLPPGAASETIDPVFKSAQSIARGKLPSPGPFFESGVGQMGGGAPGLIKAGTEAYLADKDFFSGKQFYSDKERMTHVLEQVFPLLPKAKAAFTADDEKKLRRRLSMLTGAQVYPLGPATKRSEQFRRSEELNAALARLRRRGWDIPFNVPRDEGPELPR